jgi:hypothetical protein
MLVGKIQRPCFSPVFHLLQNLVDRGADNPHRNIPVTKPVREAKARLWAVVPLMMMMMMKSTSCVFTTQKFAARFEDTTIL